VFEWDCQRRPLVRQLQLDERGFGHLPSKASSVKPSVTNHKGLLPLATCPLLIWVDGGEKGVGLGG